MDTATDSFVDTSASCTQHTIDFGSGALTQIPAKLIDEQVRLRSEDTPLQLLNILSCTVGHHSEFMVRLHLDRLIYGSDENNDSVSDRKEFSMNETRPCDRQAGEHTK
ncbi:hypothetical protein [Cryobacterium sp. TMT2-42-4]|uniref:hypothetical protein n=1 Tax=Cryobacterium sp. TMT2-42-4 TaxID=1259255 RepID=UPI001069CE1B|nr:hypothetical protein [Cryobacterium sp. TMT2-42-4]TFC37685.1 hypothetical protein E3O18_05125 [Cryobacterium sp. TMT2-42-4]